MKSILSSQQIWVKFKSMKSYMHVTKVDYGTIDQATDTEPKNVNNPDYLFDTFLIE